MNTLTIDIGNSRTKIDFWSDGGYVAGKVTCNPDIKDIKEILALNEIEGIIISSVTKESESFLRDIENLNSCVTVIFNEEEIRSHYPLNYAGHLGPDRMAAVLGANLVSPDQDKVVVDLGTAMTIDISDRQGHFVGGNISLGLKSRMQALSAATSKLPDIGNLNKARCFGNDTVEAIQSGAVSGVTGEILYSYDCAAKEYNCGICIITGGDAPYVYDLLKERIPVVMCETLVGMGLDYHLRTHYLKPCVQAIEAYRVLKHAD